MASIIQAYEYDIFISYRQKDNEEGGGEKVRGRQGSARWRRRSSAIAEAGDFSREQGAWSMEQENLPLAPRSMQRILK